ncbi:MAG: DNA mismatch repair protein MutS [Spirochaetales bacterium]|nr:DNA mismatch repair protein MutS [Spirochaetales bacterium]
MMQQYRRIKHEHGDAVLFFRMGDFYEMFEKDAKEISSLLNLTLTARNGVPMCGIPYHASQNYISRLLKAGKKIAVCEQTSLPQDGKGIAERSVVQVITPGTVVDEDYLDKASNNYLIAVGRTKNHLAIASLDLSTGDFQITAAPFTGRIEKLRREFARLMPKEILIQESLLEEDQSINRIIAEYPDLMVNRYPDWHFDLETSAEMLKSRLKVANLKGFGIGDDEPAILPAGVLLEYVADTSKSLLGHLLKIKLYTDSEFLGLDESTRRNLEIVKNLYDGASKYTLLEVLDHTRTAMGARQLKSWLLNPLNDRKAIENRLSKVETLYRNQLLLSRLREVLSGSLDLERLSALVAMDRAHAKNLLAVKQTLDSAASLENLLDEDFERWTDDARARSAVEEIRTLIERAVDEDPSVILTEGRLIRSGYSEELDSLRGTKHNRQEILNSYLAEEKERSGIQNLRIRFNKIIGYYLEVTKSNVSSVPDHFIRRQSLVGSERFTTDRLIELESQLNTATEEIVELEKDLFLKVREQVRERVAHLLDLAVWIARLDCLCSFAQAATVHGYVRPEINETQRILIEDGRHPVVEAYLPAGEFVPNSTDIDTAGVSFLLITGPNMAGKSTYLRQVALIVLMAQVGSFVPAKEAAIGLVDRIFCRVGASDNLARGESTFLVEMTETAHILHTATERSLIIMDEVGRGTSTNDGLAIAWAVTEFLLSRGAKVFFATHFHELTLIEHEKKRNLALTVVENEGDVVFLKKVKPGAADHSYGIHVAKLAGVPAEVIDRAGSILEELLRRGRKLPEGTAGESEKAGRPAPHPARQPAQTALFSGEDLLLKELASLNPDRLTPLEALSLIFRWHNELAK